MRENSLKVDLFGKETKIKLAELLSLKAYPFMSIETIIISVFDGPLS